jgi:DNA (cytosine-5)-methyltransferase 1
LHRQGILQFRERIKERCVTRLTCFDLFSGCGGLSSGLRQAGIDIRWANEVDVDAAKTYRASHPECTVLEEDIDVLHQRLLDSQSGLPEPGDVDLVAGGPPCQGFSGYNRYQSARDPRNSLVESFLDVVAHLRPRFVLMENVPGMLALNKGKLPLMLLEALSSLGYETRLGILQAGHYGVPQNRWRVFVVAAAKGSTLPSFPVPTHAFPRTTIFGATGFRANVVRPPGASDLFWQPVPNVTVWDAISDLPEIANGGGADVAKYTGAPRTRYQADLREGAALFNHRTARLGELMLARCKAVPKRPGAGWLDLPDELKPRNLLRHGDKRYDNRFGRLHWDGTFNTILTEAHMYWSRVIHPERDRVISVRESARAQGFSDGVRFYGSLSSCYRQVGNAVPPPLGEVLGSAILLAAGASLPIEMEAAPRGTEEHARRAAGQY